MSFPIIDENEGYIILEWRSEQLRITIRRLQFHNRDGRITGRITIEGNVPLLVDGEHIYESNFDFTSLRSRQSLIKYLTERLEYIDWLPL